ncbi:MAG: HD domain-containing protein [Oscillospiraceae bacterium]|jgi:tRNA nucleotidyltransferase (CCA-adding enzyme)|nr:HD domain-containing protein [Oscillospiraceae bacterium]
MDNHNHDRKVWLMRGADETLSLAYALAREIAGAGGRAYFAGGRVRDALRGVEDADADVDLEVYGLTPEILRSILGQHGAVNAVGKSFGVLRLGGYGLEVSMPRRERATGRGHKDFDVSVDPFMPFSEACVRRDFTVNAMLRDALTGEVIDPYGGLDDIKARILRHVRAETFAEDPLRAYRAARFAARFGYAVAPETVRLCASMDLAPLSRERVFAELAKALTLASKPSLFFNALADMDQLGASFLEISRMRGVPQDPRHHPEGDVWVHTMGVLDQAARLREQANEPLFYMLAALCHDIGKPDCTVIRDEAERRISAVGHEDIGVELARTQLHRLTNQNALIDYVLNMVQMHMRPNRLAQSRSQLKKTRAMFDKSVNPNDLILLSKADVLVTSQAERADELEVFLYDRLDDYRKRMREPMLNGRDLIAAGFVPGPGFSEWIARARLFHMSGLTTDRVLRQLVSERRKRSEENFT